MQCKAKTRPTFESFALMERPTEFQWLASIFREAFRESRIGRLLSPRENRPNPQYTSPEDIISRSVQFHGQPLPPHFMEIFQRLPELVWSQILMNLTAHDIRNMRIAAAMFHNLLSDTRQNFPLLPINSGRVVLLGTEKVRVYRNYSTLEINHEDFTKSLQTIDCRTMVIRQEGKLEAASFHVLELRCEIIQIQIVNPIDSGEEDELAEIFEQINRNDRITMKVALMVRSEHNKDAVRQRLEGIASRNPHIPLANFCICVMST